jgi:hypothetical protein
MTMSNQTSSFITADDFDLLPLRQQADVRNGWLRARLETILPDLMARENFDVWLVIAREYNEDPVIMTLLPEPQMSARRRTILLFHRREDGSLGRYTLSRYGLGDFYESAWDADNESQDEALLRLLEQIQPERIGINTSETFAFGDGLSHTLYTQLADALGETWMVRMHSAENLCVGWLETRLPDEMMAYGRLVALGHAITAEAFSSRVIHAGITTTDDVVWWMRQRMHDLGLQAWFQPTIAIQAQGQRYDEPAKRNVIMAGDLLHSDMGFYYLGLATDQQQHAYVLRAGENDAPEGIKQALAHGNRLQDIHMEAMQIGRTGNDILLAALEKARGEGIRPMIYSHPLGYHGHAAGPTIGLWDSQGGVAGRGDYPVYDSTCYSIELNVKYDVPEWDGQEIRIALEEDAMMQDGVMHWLHERQKQLHLIG